MDDLNFSEEQFNIDNDSVFLSEENTDIFDGLSLEDWVAKFYGPVLEAAVDEPQEVTPFDIVVLSKSPGIFRAC